MFMLLICILHLYAMFNVDMSMSSCIYSIQALEYLLGIYITFLYDLSLSNMLVIFRIRLFNLFKYVGSMSLISAISQHADPCHRSSMERHPGPNDFHSGCLYDHGWRTEQLVWQQGARRGTAILYDAASR
jgi:hypothetical protein